jgi:hypothetical protein
VRRLIVAAAILAFPLTLAAQNVPDPTAVHGKPLPDPGLADATVTVRVVREAMANALPGQTVTLTVAGKEQTGKTNEAGRAEFTNLPPDAEVTARTTVDGEALTSETFRVPTRGGVRVALIAGLDRVRQRQKEEAAAARSAPAVRGIVTLGGDTRIVGEFQNDNLFLFYELDIVNNARAPVDTGGPFELDLPSGAGGARLTEGSPENATIDGRHVVVPGPFAPGTTRVNLSYQLRFNSTDHTFVQRLPVTVEQLPVFIQRIGGLSVSSPQLQPGRDVVSDNGTTFASAAGSGLAAGTDVTVHLSNLPAHSRLPGYLALAFAGVIIAAGIWLSMTAGRGDAVRQSLIARRDALLTRLEELEVKRRAGKVADDRYLARRQRLMTDLEEVYHELDETGSRTQGGDEGVAA